MHESVRSVNLSESVVTKVAVYVYGIAAVAAGIFDLGWGDFDASHQPIQAFGDHIPGVKIFAYITAVWMIGGGAAIMLRRTARTGAGVLAVIYFIFTIFWLPRLYTAPHYLGFRITIFLGVLTGVGMELIASAAGALTFASMETRSSSWPRTILITRWIFGLCALDFGANHLADVADNLVYVPKWMPLGGEFWVILTGICFLLAGIAILSGIQDVVAARLLALEFLAFNAVALPQFIFAHPDGHAAWGGNAFNLALVAACWIFADTIASRHAEREEKTKARLAEVS